MWNCVEAAIEWFKYWITFCFPVELKIILFKDLLLLFLSKTEKNVLSKLHNCLLLTGFAYIWHRWALDARYLKDDLLILFSNQWQWLTNLHSSDHCSKKWPPLLWLILVFSEAMWDHLYSYGSSEITKRYLKEIDMVKRVVTVSAFKGYHIKLVRFPEGLQGMRVSEWRCQLYVKMVK